MTVTKSNKGFVSLVGAGPGDPELITMKGLIRLKGADVVLYDSLVNPALLQHCKIGAKKIFVGKRRSLQSMSQSEITNMLLDYASKGKRVVRLKGGDPLVFGRGGEEALALSLAGVLYEIVPGISAGVGVAAYAGIPLTHRDHSSDVIFVTGESGHDLSEDEKFKYWQRVSQAYTIVIFMGLAHLEENLTYLLRCGRSNQTPAAIIQNGTYPGQRVVAGTIDTLSALARENNIKAPSLVIIGDVVSYSSKLNWYERQELFGARLLFLSNEERFQDNLFSTSSAAEIRHMPLSEISFFTEKKIRSKLRQLSFYDWIILTSINSALVLVNHMRQESLDSRFLKKAKLAVIGYSTANFLKEHGLIADFISSKQNSEGFIETFKKKISRTSRLMYLRGDLSRGLISEYFTKRVKKFDELTVYKNKPVRLNEEQLQDMRSFNPHYVVVSSSSAALRAQKALDDMLDVSSKLVALGPITAATLASMDLKQKIIISKKPDMDSVYAVILKDWSSQK